ncbi:hypothetical protein AO1008_04839 [Aspergillus oryzae 100-8]|uniref:Uncharacterized protein n=1 Tax=Aspergillus oryzae (strain 3.042) TaxID=1160506 RepID=I7ZPA7_ASPO3|nr:hypothetical protein Ao3042_10414 [Aspergillus oryzae 3.042]KDE78525.1 hypothetical protein AO1008_04839 [Aspergillus oryzae 100-8]|eukprot:EIT73697.1 hypothetical protein Ao3042_10414 [Aspergillus oryzae 3.042]
MADSIFDHVSNGNTPQYPAGKARIENIGNIYFSFIVMAVSLILIAFSSFYLPFVIKKYSQVCILWEDHRNDLFISGFGILTPVAVLIFRWNHAGRRLIVEVDVVMDSQNNFETLPNVDRAFVHIDYESTHRPEHAKKIYNNLAAERTDPVYQGHCMRQTLNSSQEATVLRR